MKTIKTMINAMASRWRNRVTLQEKRGSGTNEVCPHCGAQFTPSRLSFREMVLAAICGSLLLLILVPAGWMANSSRSARYKCGLVFELRHSFPHPRSDSPR
jgi:hypothetical protein